MPWNWGRCTSCLCCLESWEERFCDPCAEEISKENDPDYDPFRSGFEQ